MNPNIYNPYYGDPQKGSPNFGKPLHVNKESAGSSRHALGSL